MSEIKDYIDYRKHLPEYKDWKKNRDLNEAKKIAYLNSNQVDKTEFNKDVERAKIVLNAVDVMDEYSQSRAEEMEQVTQTAIGTALNGVSYASVALSLLSVKFVKGCEEAFNEAFRGNFKNSKKLLIPAAIFILPTVIFSLFANNWAARKEIQASRVGRQESMNKDLASIKQFALMTDEQNKQIEAIAPTIEVSKKDSKKIIEKPSGLGIISSIKSIFKKDDTEKYIANVPLKDNKNYSQQEILEAKKDKELIQSITEKIDIASQEYAENAENTINIATTIAMSGSALTGFVTHLITKHIKSLESHSKVIGAVVSCVAIIASTILGTKIQKQASRVARYKVKQELLNSPEQLVYVDEEKYKNTNAPQPTQKKDNFFKRLKALIIDNKEYNNYLKENNVSNIQKRRAKEQITLTKEQEERAIQLQNNTFNMFNKLDEKSQKYSESAEAVGNTVQSIVSMLTMLPGMVISSLTFLNGKTKAKKILGAVGYFASLMFPILLNFVITRDQKKATRVANMLAIKELNDYRYFLNENPSEKNIHFTDKKNLSPALQKMLNKAI